MLSEIIIGVIVAVVAAIVVKLFGLGNTTTTVYTKGYKQQSKILGFIFVLGWIMFYGGLFYTFSWAAAKGFEDIHTMTGFAYTFIGAMILFFRKMYKIFNGN